MKVLKLFFVVFALLFAFTSISSAQTDDNSKPMKLKKTPEQYAEKKASKMKDKLSLSDSQYKQVYDIFYQAALDRTTRMNSGEKPSKEQRKSYMQDINTKIESVLTAEQLSQWQKYKSEHKGKHKNKDKKRSKGQDKRIEGQGETDMFKKEPCKEK
jgi:Spy/CpxP family protein refolding chaperone